MQVSSTTRKSLVFMVLAVMMGVLVLVRPTSAEAAWCTQSYPSTPSVNTWGEVAAESHTSCDGSMSATQYTYIYRLRTLWPDSQVAFATDSGTKSYFSAYAHGCEASASGSSHRYKAKGWHSTKANALWSSIVWLTCTA